MALLRASCEGVKVDTLLVPESGCQRSSELNRTHGKPAASSKLATRQPASGRAHFNLPFLLELLLAGSDMGDGGVMATVELWSLGGMCCAVLCEGSRRSASRRSLESKLPTLLWITTESIRAVHVELWGIVVLGRRDGAGVVRARTHWQVI